MSLTIILGILLIAIGVFSAGSFAVPFEKIKGFKAFTGFSFFLAAFLVFKYRLALVMRITL